MSTVEYGELTPERKSIIDAMGRSHMCNVWRFAQSGDWRITGDCGTYFKKRLFDDLGGFSPAISKSIGLGK